MAKVLDCDLKVSEFELHLRFPTNTLEKGMSLFLSKCGSNSFTAVFLLNMALALPIEVDKPIKLVPVV